MHFEFLQNLMTASPASTSGLSPVSGAPAASEIIVDQYAITTTALPKGVLSDNTNTGKRLRHAFTPPKLKDPKKAKVSPGGANPSSGTVNVSEFKPLQCAPLNNLFSTRLKICSQITS